MGFLIFLGVVLAGALAVLGITRMYRPNEPVTPVVLLAKPLGEAETELIVQRLKAEGIWVREQDTRLAFQADGYANTYAGEIWVKESDYTRARQLIG